MGVHGGLIKAFVTTLPFTLVGVLGAYNQVARDSFDTPEYGEVMSSRINAFVGPVQLVHRSLALPKTEASPETVEKVANAWLVDYQAGKLEDLPPMVSGDSSRDGVKQQVLTAKGILVSNLIRVGDRSVRAGQVDQASHSYALALKLTRVMMFSDLTSLGNGISFENCILRRLNALNQSSSRMMTPTTTHEFQKVVNSEMRAELADPSLKAQARQHLADQYRRATSGSESLKQILDDPSSGYELSILFANARRVEALLALQRKIMSMPKKSAPSLLAQGTFGFTPGSI